MSENELLVWMSARGKGSWQQFRAAVEQLHLADDDDLEEEGGAGDEATDLYALPIYQLLRLNLQRIGHAEFFGGADGSDWRVAPPSLAMTPAAEGWLGIVAGARSPKLLERLDSAASVVDLSVRCLPASPDQFLARSIRVNNLAEFAQRVGLHCQPDAPLTILMSLPAIDDPKTRRRVELPFGQDWKIERFSPSSLRWESAGRNDAVSASATLFRFSLRQYERQVLFCSNGECFTVPGQVGKYLALLRRRRNILQYDRTAGLLTIPASCRPPFLIERALILCSGLLPSYEPNSLSSVLHYTAIPPNIARLAASLLRQEIKWTTL